MKDVPIPEICKAATWASDHTFSKHNALVHASRADATFGSTVMQTVLDLVLKLPPPSEGNAWKSPQVEHA